jgi:gliding motility-associated-like protein
MKTSNNLITSLRIRNFLILCFFYMFINEVRSSHIVGGEMTYRCLGGQSYEITLTLRRDCFLGSPEAAFDDPAHIGIFDGEGNQVRNLGQFGIILLPFRKDDTLNEILKTECEVIGGDVCVHTTTYRGKIELPFRAGGYILAYQRCCRNESITNIIEPKLTGATYSMVISEDALRYQNKGPKFGPFPPIYICGDSNRSIIFDASLFDEEGDSLVYSLCVPYAGADTANSKPTRPSKPPFPLVMYKPPFGLNDLLGGNSNLRIDPRTGLLTGQPNAIGQYLVGICIEEYRNGRILSRLRRDFQYNVRMCTTNPVSKFDADNTVLCVGDSIVNFTNGSERARDYTWIFDYPSKTYTSKDTNPSFTFPKPGKYTVALIAERAKDCIDTAYKDIFVYGDGLLKSDFDAVYGSCNDSIEISFIDKSVDSLLKVSHWNWFVQLKNKIFTSVQQNPKYSFSDTGRLFVSLLITSQGGCTDSISNPDSRFQYTWSPSTDLSCDDCPDPIASPSQDILYKVTITDGNCTEEDSVLVKVSTLLDIDIAGDTVICNDTVNLYAIGGLESSVEWSNSRDFNTILDSGSFQFTTNLNGSQTFYVRAKSAANCPGSDSITVNNEKVLFTTSIDSVTICEDDTFKIKLNNLRAEHQAIITWSPDNRIVFGQGTDSIHSKFPGCGIFKLDVKLQNQYGCESSDSVEIRAICKPQVDFATDKNCDNTLVSFNNLSSSGKYKWQFGDGNESIEKNPIHNYQNPGTYTVTLLVEAECKNEITKVIDVGFIRVSIKDRVISCNGAPVKLNENPDTNYLYEWSPVLGLDDPKSPNPTASVSQTTVFQVRIIDKTLADCFIDRNVTVFVPPPINLQTNNDTILCENDTIVLNAKTDVIATIEWIDEIGILLGTGYDLKRLFRDSMRLFTYATDIYGCGVRDSFRVVPIIRNTKIDGKKNLCPEAVGNLKFINLDGHKYNLDWRPTEQIVNDSNKTSIYIKAKDTTIFYLNMINEYGCIYTDSFQVDISRFEPPLTAYAEDDTIFLGQSTVLHVIPGYTNYNWIIPYNLSCTNCTDPVANPDNSILYTVEATNADGCVDRAEVVVIVIRPKCNEDDIFMPNIFSPNNDGENDILSIRSNFLEKVELYIYNRWGQKVFETKDINHWWDGKFNGTDLAPDVYGYYFKVQCVDGKTYAKKGNVTLIK